MEISLRGRHGPPVLMRAVERRWDHVSAIVLTQRPRMVEKTAKDLDFN